MRKSPAKSRFSLKERAVLTAAATVCLIASCCAPWAPQSRVISSGYFGFQPMRTRAVVCMIDADFSREACLALVPAAITQLNEAANHTLFRYYGEATPEGAKELYRAGALVVGVDSLPPNVLGVTLPKLTQSRAIDQVLILLSTQLFATNMCAFSPLDVLVHEFGHAVGLTHSDWSESRMGPAERPEIQGFTAADRRSLQAVYADE